MDLERPSTLLPPLPFVLQKEIKTVSSNSMNKVFYKISLLTSTSTFFFSTIEFGTVDM